MEFIREIGFVKTGAVALLVYLVAVTIYRLTLHPLAKYPGPLLSKISGWPDALAAARGDRHLHHYHLHCKYGEVVRISPNSLSFNSSQAWHDIYTDRHSNVIKTGWTEASSYINSTTNTHVIPDKKGHSAKRRLLSHAFSEHALKSAEDLAISRIEAFCDRLSPTQIGEKTAEEWSQSKDMSHWMSLLTMDVLGEFCFGKSFGAVEAGDSPILDLLTISTRLTQMVAYLPLTFPAWQLSQSKRALAFINQRAAYLRWGYRARMTELTKERARAEDQGEEDCVPSRKDFFSYLFQAQDPETGDRLPPESFIGEAGLLVAAGTDTSSKSMAACLFYLLRNPETLEKLTTEIRDEFSDVEDIRSGMQLSSMKYLRACIDEAMRMSPAIPGGLSRKVLPGGTNVDGRHIPAGVVVSSSIYGLHHNEKHHPDSFSFLPERWIPGSKTPLFEVTEESNKMERDAFVPFSTGVRNCVGKNLAYMEMLTTIARLVWLFDMRFSQKGANSAGAWNAVEKGRQQTNVFHTKDWLIVESAGPFVDFKKRVDTL